MREHEVLTPAPDNSIRVVPEDRLQEAIENGAELVFRQPETDTVRFIPAEHLERALLAGGRLLSDDRTKRILTTSVEFSVAKRHRQLKIDPSELSPHSHRAKRRLEDKLRSRFGKVREHLLAKLTRSARKFAKDDDGLPDEKELFESLGLQEGSEFWATLWASLPSEVAMELEDAALSGVGKGALEASLHVTGAGLISKLNAQAAAFAKDRAAGCNLRVRRRYGHREAPRCGRASFEGL